MIHSPYILVAMFVGVFVLGSMSGYNIRDAAAKSAAAKAFKASELQRVLLQEKINVVSAQYEAERQRASRVAVERTNTIREIYRTSPPVDINCRVPDTVYGLLANSVRDANAAASSEFGSELPNVATTSKSIN